MLSLASEEVADDARECGRRTKSGGTLSPRKRRNFEKFFVLASSAVTAGVIGVVGLKHPGLGGSLGNPTGIASADGSARGSRKCGKEAERGGGTGGNPCAEHDEAGGEGKGRGERGNWDICSVCGVDVGNVVGSGANGNGGSFRIRRGGFLESVLSLLRFDSDAA